MKVCLLGTRLVARHFRTVSWAIRNAGRGRFERDETGRVARLVIREGPREFIAIRR